MTGINPSWQWDIDREGVAETFVKMVQRARDGVISPREAAAQIIAELEKYKSKDSWYKELKVCARRVILLPEEYFSIDHPSVQNFFAFVEKGTPKQFWQAHEQEAKAKVQDIVHKMDAGEMTVYAGSMHIVSLFLNEYIYHDGWADQVFDQCLFLETVPEGEITVEHPEYQTLKIVFE